ncbi:Protein of unknown function [Bacillus mycoides]|nr:Protein of unknown function [Bacillus mycoides]
MWFLFLGIANRNYSNIERDYGAIHVENEQTKKKQVPL